MKTNGEYGRKRDAPRVVLNRREKRNAPRVVLFVDYFRAIHRTFVIG